MTKIDFTKIEETMNQAMQAMFVKKIQAGKSVVSARAARFYAIDKGPHPKPQDPVIEVLDEMRREVRELLAAERGEVLEEEPIVIERKESVEPESEEEEPEGERLSRRQYLILTLLQHLGWMRQKRVGNLNAKIGTTKTEVDELIHKENLTPEEMKRLEEIVERTHQVKIEAMKELGLETDEVVVEKQRKKHITKRFNIREDWLPT